MRAHGEVIRDLHFVQPGAEQRVSERTSERKQLKCKRGLILLLHSYINNQVYYHYQPPRWYSVKRLTGLLAVL